MKKNKDNEGGKKDKRWWKTMMVRRARKGGEKWGRRRGSNEQGRTHPQRSNESHLNFSSLMVLIFKRYISITQWRRRDRRPRFAPVSRGLFTSIALGELPDLNQGTQDCAEGIQMFLVLPSGAFKLLKRTNSKWLIIVRVQHIYIPFPWDDWWLYT